VLCVDYQYQLKSMPSFFVLVVSIAACALRPFVMVGSSGGSGGINDCSINDSSTQSGVGGKR